MLNPRSLNSWSTGSGALLGGRPTLNLHKVKGSLEIAVDETDGVQSRLFPLYTPLSFYITEIPLNSIYGIGRVGVVWVVGVVGVADGNKSGVPLGR